MSILTEKKTKTITETKINRGYPAITVRTPLISFSVSVRLIIVTTILFLIGITCSVVAITLGDYPLSLSQVVNAIFGVGQKFHLLIVREWRAPVALAAVVFGALLGLGGAIFQSLTRNPLGSPDIIGFSSGSYFAVVILMLVYKNSNYWALVASSIVGGILTALVVYLLAWRKGVQGFRLIIVGIGVSAMLGSVNSYLITRANVQDAMMVGFWGAGSLNRVTWASMIPSLILCVIIFACAGLLSRSLKFIEMGDDIAKTVGIDTNKARLTLVIIGVSTDALVTAAAGPIGFIALVAPQIARRLTRSPGVSMLSSCAMGAALLAFAQLSSLVIASFYRSIPVGLLTVSIGGIYMIWVLVREARRQYSSGTIR